MALTIDDHRAIVRGLKAAGYVCKTAPQGASNPIHLDWWVGEELHRFRLWAFDITHGGGGATVRAADEFRIQITNGPTTRAAFDVDGTDLLIGYSRERDAIVAYDRRWLEKWTDKFEETGGGGSPSVQVKEADIQAGHDQGIHHLTKGAGFGEAHIVTLNPDSLPGYLLNHSAALRGEMSGADLKIENVSESSLTNVVQYCRSRGFPFEAELIARYIASALTKPLVILSGVSGTGKSKLAELVAEFYTTQKSLAAPSSETPPVPGDRFTFAANETSTPSPDRFALVAVRPDWTDNQSILGFVNPITNTYESTQALDLILKAKLAHDAHDIKPEAPRYFMLLDEMNLARVEHYFSDWLAATESRRETPDGSIIQQAVPLHRGVGLKTSLRDGQGGVTVSDVPASLALPTNVIVTGTVNVDETTYGFSPKVLDRAMVLEFDEVDLDRLRSGATVEQGDAFRLPDTLPPFRLANRTDYAALPEPAHRYLVALNAILEEARLHIGYRAANEIALFMRLYNEMLPVDPSDAEWLRALDIAILQKILPRLSGNRAKLERPLARLCFYLRDLVSPSDSLTASDIAAGEAKLPRSFARAYEMLRGLQDFGFVSFFK